MKQSADSPRTITEEEAMQLLRDQAAARAAAGERERAIQAFRYITLKKPVSGIFFLLLAATNAFILLRFGGWGDPVLGPALLIGMIALFWTGLRDIYTHPRDKVILLLLEEWEERRKIPVQK